MHESLEKIKEYSSYYDWLDHISIYDLRYLISQAEKVEVLRKENWALNKEIGKYSALVSEIAEGNEKLANLTKQLAKKMLGE